MSTGFYYFDLALRKETIRHIYYIPEELNKYILNPQLTRDGSFYNNNSEPYELLELLHGWSAKMLRYQVIEYITENCKPLE